LKIQNDTLNHPKILLNNVAQGPRGCRISKLILPEDPGIFELWYITEQKIESLFTSTETQHITNIAHHTSPEHKKPNTSKRSEETLPQINFNQSGEQKSTIRKCRSFVAAEKVIEGVKVS